MAPTLGALAGQFGLELRPVLTDDLVEQGGLGPVAYVSRSRAPSRFSYISRLHR